MKVEVQKFTPTIDFLIWHICCQISVEAVVVVIVWWLDFLLHLQSAPITTNGVLDTTLYKVCQ